MKLLVLTVCIAMIAVQVQRLRLRVSTQRVLFLAFWLVLVAWALTSWAWLAIPAVVLLLAALFWNLGPLLALFGSAVLAARLRRGGSREVGHVMYRSPLLALAGTDKLTRYLEHPNDNLRRAAVSEMGSRQDPSLTPVLLDLAREDPEARAEAIDALGRSGDVSAAVPVLDYLDDEDDDVRLRAVCCLARLRAPETVERLVEFLDGSRPGSGSLGALRQLSDCGGTAAIGWVWANASDHLRGELVGWLRERVDRDDETAPAAIESALETAEGRTRQALEDLQRHLLCLELEQRHPEWFRDVPADHVPEPTAQPLRLDPSLADELGLTDRAAAGNPVEAVLRVEAGQDDTLLCSLERSPKSSDEPTLERRFPRRMLIGLVVHGSEDRPVRFRHEHPELAETAFTARPILLDLPLHMPSRNLAPFHVAGAPNPIRSAFEQQAVVDLAVSSEESPSLAVRVRGWKSLWDRHVPPFVAEIPLAQLFLAPLVTGRRDPTV